MVAVGCLAHRALAEDSGGLQQASKPKEPQKTLWEQDTLLGDMGGFRTTAAKAGIQLGLTYTADFLGNTDGGLRRSFIAEGVLAPRGAPWRLCLGRSRSKDRAADQGRNHFRRPNAGEVLEE
jgi:hypothetical protein